MSVYVYRLCRPHEWRRALRQGYFYGNEKDIRDGYIHLSTKQELFRSAQYVLIYPNIYSSLTGYPSNNFCIFARVRLYFKGVNDLMGLRISTKQVIERNEHFTVYRVLYPYRWHVAGILWKVEVGSRSLERQCTVCSLSNTSGLNSISLYIIVSLIDLYYVSSFRQNAFLAPFQWFLNGMDRSPLCNNQE